MWNLLNLKTEAFGLDISGSSLKFIKLKKKGKFFDLASYGESPIKNGIIKNGEIRDSKSLIKIIKDSLAEAKGEKLRTKYVVASLPEEKAFLQVIQLPKIPEEDLRSAVIYEAENYIPLPIEDVYLDFQIVKPVFNHLDHLDILIAALPRKIVDRYTFCLKEAGLKPKVLEIESLAISRSLIKNGLSNSPVLLIDFGMTKTSFIIFSGYSLIFTSSIPISSQQITEAISKALKVDSARAEKLKKEYGLELDSKNKEIVDIIKPILVNLVEQIKKHIDYYQYHSFHEHLSPGGRGLEKILFFGGGANLKGLSDFLASELHLSIEIANPFINVFEESKKSKPPISFEQSLSYATAFGLALRGIKEL